MTTKDSETRRGEVTVRLPFQRESARTARELVDDLMSACGATDDVRQDASLVVHELVINAVVHGRPDAHDQIEFAARVDGRQLLVTVFDWGTGGRVAVRPPDPERANGRGLAIVAALSTSWSVDRGKGTLVGAVLAL
jgi:serine/threonine-protein kinase RsbW